MGFDLTIQALPLFAVLTLVLVVGATAIAAARR